MLTPFIHTRPNPRLLTPVYYLWVSCVLLLTSTEVYSDDSINLATTETRIYSAAAGSNTKALMQLVNYHPHVSIQLISADSDIAQQTNVVAPELAIVKPQRRYELTTEGSYIELIGLKRAIHPGEKITLILDFAHGDSYAIDALVLKPGEHIHENAHGHSVAHQDHD